MKLHAWAAAGERVAEHQRCEFVAAVSEEYVGADHERAYPEFNQRCGDRIEISLSFCELRNRNVPLVAWFLDLRRETMFGLLVAAPPCAAHNI